MPGRVEGLGMREAGEADEAIFFVGGDVVGCEGYGGGSAAEHNDEAGARVGMWGDWLQDMVV